MGGSSSGAAFGNQKWFAVPQPYVIGTTEFTLGVDAQVVAAPDTMFPGGAGNIAIGGATSTTNGGYISIIQAGFTEGNPLAATTALIAENTIINAVEILDAATNEEVETANGETVFGLLQASDAAGGPPPVPVVDGDVIAANPLENLQISFVYRTKANPAVLALYLLSAGTYRVSYKRHYTLASLPYTTPIVGIDPLPDLATAATIFVGTFASNRAALAYVRLHHWDSNGDGTGTFVVGQYWLDTTLGCLRWFDGTYVQGNAPIGVARVVYVRTTGSDVDGDGTLAFPYLTLRQAYLDKPISRGTANNTSWEINIAEAASFELNFTMTGDSQFPTVKITGSAPVGDTTIFAGATDTDVIAAVVVDTLKDGRAIQMTNPAGGAWTVNQWKGRRILVNTGPLAGKIGYVYRNTVDTLYVVLDDRTNFGVVNGFQVGNSITILRYPTTITPNAGGNSNTLQGITFTYLNMDAGSRVFNLASGYSYLTDVYYRGRFNQRETGQLFCNRTYFHNNGAATLNWYGGTQDACLIWNGSPCVVDMMDTATLVRRTMNCAAPQFGNWVFGCTVVFTGCDDVRFSTQRIDTITGLAATAAPMILLDDCNTWLYLTDTVGGAFFDIALPAIYGTVAGTNFINVNYDVTTEGKRGFTLWMDPATDVTTSGGKNRCAFNGVAGVYADLARGFEILGTGNHQKVLIEPQSWVGDAVSPFVGEMVGRNEAMAFADAADLIGYSGFKIPQMYVPGTNLEFEFSYVTEDPASGHVAVIDLDTALYRDGTDDASAEPPTNLFQDTGNLVPVSAAAGRQTLSQRFGMNTAGGTINAIALASGHHIGLRLRRNGTAGGDNCAGKIWVLSNTIRVWNVGL